MRRLRSSARTRESLSFDQRLLETELAFKELSRQVESFAAE